MNEDQIQGMTQRFAGKAQGAVGDLTGDAKIQAEGSAREAAGTVQQAVGTATENIAEILKKIQAQLTDLAGQLKQSAGEATDVLSDRGKQAVTAVGEQVQESPVISLMVVGAVGYLLGFLSHRD